MTTPVVQLRSVARSYLGPPEVTALKPTDLQVGRGELLAITGRSGSGKSTLLHILGLLDSPTCGAYLLDDHDTAGLSDTQRAKIRAASIGFVFQSFHLLAHRTATDNVMIALMYHGTVRHHRRALAEQALDRVGMAHRRDALPTTLSGGERQRVAIARALVTNPSMILADEPTGNLDSATSNDVMALLHDIHTDGQTILIVTHDETVAQSCPRRVRMHDGTLIEEPQQ